MREDYVNLLTPEQKKAIKTERKILKEEKTMSARKKTLKNEQHALGKPKKSPGAFMLFRSENCKGSKPSDAKIRWDGLSEYQRIAYRVRGQELHDAYE